MTDPDVPAAGWTSALMPLDAIRLFRVLHEHGVRHVVVGGIAAIAHGYSGSTRDADTVPALDAENLDRLATALRALDAKLYANPARTDLRDDGSPPEADDFELTGAALRGRLQWQFVTTAGPLDVLLVVDGPGGYDVLVRRAEPRTVAGFDVLVASLEDLVEAKETAGRDKDLRALGELRRLLARRSPP